MQSNSLFDAFTNSAPIQQDPRYVGAVATALIVALVLSCVGVWVVRQLERNDEENKESPHF